MSSLLTRLWDDLLGRAGGPMRLRLILQPAMAAFLAFRAGWKDARDRKTPYLATVVTDRSQRKSLLREGLQDIGKVLIAAVVLDLIYQIVVLHRFYPGETLIVATVLALVPYLLIRGPANRLARRRRDAASAPR
jgi:hypothetical protein